MGYFAGVSNIVQDLIAEVFEDDAFIDGFLAENARRLGASYRNFAGGERGSALRSDRGAGQAIGRIGRRADQGAGKWALCKAMERGIPCYPARRRMILPAVSISALQVYAHSGRRAISGSLWFATPS